jgi:Helicase conserved C-terminal domain
MVIHLRPYQRLALYHLRRSLEAGAWRQYLALQLAETLRQEGLEVGLLMEGSRALHTPVVVATVQSLTPEATDDLLAAIEHAAGGQSVATIGLTATPYRNDEQSMLSLLPICAFARTIPEMVPEGYLAPLTWKPVQLDLDLAQVATTRQSGELDYAETTLAGQLLREAITARLVEHAASLIEQRPTLVFAASVQHAAYLSAAFRARGLAAAPVSGRSSRRQRDELFAGWKSGTIQVVCNCTLLTEGYDFPGIAALVIARPTLSPGLYRSQQYARQPGRAPEHQWIERRYLPLRQQVTLVQEATRSLFREGFAGKEAVWLEEPATEKQLEMLGRYQKRLPEQARAAGWTKREASEAIAFYQLRRVLFYASDE